MDVILVPGFWLDGSSWDPVVRELESAGYATHALTLPGLESRDAPRSGVGLRDHVEAVVAVVDATEGPVVLVGHSGGAAVVHAAADARPDRVTRVVYVDAVPLGAGGLINDELPVVGDEIPLPDWSAFGDEDLVDLTDEIRVRFRERAIPIPARVASDRQELHDERRYDVPVTVITCEFTGDQLREWIAAGIPYVAELARVKDYELVDLPTGHWPQLTKPDELASAVVAAVGKART